MGMVLNHNLMAGYAFGELNKNTNNLSKSLKKVSTGQKINNADDDASGYSISEKMRTQIRSLEQDNQNAQNGASLLKVAEGAVNSTVDILRTLKERAVNAANDTNSDADRAVIQKEIDQSLDQVDDNSNISFNGQTLIDGSKCKWTNATCTALTNQHLHESTTDATRLVNLKDRGGDSLCIFSTDNVTISFVTDGKSYSTTMQVGEKSIGQLINAANATFNPNAGAVSAAADALADAKSKAQDVFDAAALAALKKYNYNTNDPRYVADMAAAQSAYNSAIAPFQSAYDKIKDSAPFAFKLDYSTTSFIGIDGNGNSVYTADGTNALTLNAQNTGMYYQIAGFNIQITDNKGTVKTAANTALDDFAESIRGVNETEDTSIILQTGTKSAQNIKVGFSNMSSVALGLKGKDGGTVSVGTQEKANVAISAFDFAISKALNLQTTIGAYQSRLDYTEANITTATENTTAAESVIRDADMALEMTNYTKNNVLMQAAQSMLSQANQSSSGALSLLQG